MSKLRQAAEQSLEALETYLTMDTVEESHLLEVDIAPKAINALRAALAEPEPRNQCGETCERAKLCAICTRGLEEPEHKPVAWYDSLSGWTDFGPYRPHRKPSSPSAEWIPLYASPPKKELTCVCGAVWEGEQMVHAPRKREWVGLTDEEMDELVNRFARYGLAREIESKLKEKNGG